MPHVKHVVVFKLKESTPSEVVREIYHELSSLRDVIPGLLDFTGGRHSSHEGLDQGFTHGFVMTFADVASRDGYLPHPEHQRVKQMIIEHLDGGLDAVVAVDWLED
jgi:hypothetical protein